MAEEKKTPMVVESTAVTYDDLKDKVLKYKNEGWRLLTMTAVDIDENTVEVLYHFDKDLEMEHLRLSVGKQDTVPSISDIYFAAFLVENEIQDQFGLCFKGLVLDFDRTLYKDEEVQTFPFCKYTVTKA